MVILRRQFVQSRRRSFRLTIAATAVAVLATLGVAGFSINDLRNINSELKQTNEALQENRDVLNEANADLRQVAAENSQAKSKLSELLAALSRPESNSDLGPDPKIGLLIKKANEQISRLNQINATNSDKQKLIDAISKAIRVEQTAEVTGAPDGREGELRNWHKIKYEITVGELDVTLNNGIRYSDSRIIEKVQYRFSERWYKNPIKTLENRASNFSYSIRVWGPTVVEVAIFVKEFKEPFIRRSLMSLSERQTKVF